MKSSGNPIKLFILAICLLSAIFYISPVSLQSFSGASGPSDCSAKITDAINILMSQELTSHQFSQLEETITRLKLQNECLEELKKGISKIQGSASADTSRRTSLIMKSLQKIQDTQTDLFMNSNSGNQEDLPEKVEKSDNGQFTDFRFSTFRNLRRLQAQIINENQNNQNVQTNTQTTDSQTTYGTKDGQTVSESTLVVNNNAQVDTGNLYNLNVDKNAATPASNAASVPGTGINLSGLGFSFPNLSGGLFTQTVQTSGRITITTTKEDDATTTSTLKDNNNQITQQSIAKTSNISSVTNQTSNRNQTTYTTEKPGKPASFSQQPNATVTSKATGSQEFSGLIFYHPIPNDFLIGEKFNFRGRVTQNFASTVKIPVNIMFRRTTNPDTFYCSTILQAGVKEFDFDCDIKNPGDFYLSAFAGTAGQATSTVRKISSTIDRTIPQADKPDPVTGISYEFVNNELTFKWDSRQPITKITLSQNTAVKEYLFSNFKNKFNVDFKEFPNFRPNIKTTFTVQEANAQSGSAQKRNSQFSDPSSLDFIALQHEYAEQQDSLKIDDIPWIVTKDDEITIRGRSTSALKNQIVLVNPSNQFQEYKFINNDQVTKVPANVNINKTIKLTQNGNYILQINDDEGKAVLNRPIYVYTPDPTNPLPGIPIVPDFESLKPEVANIGQILKEQPKTKTERQRILLDLINSKRREFGVPPVQLDDKLTQLAQFYASDMVRRGFSGHYNPEGDGPGERAKTAGIYTPIGQNLAMNPNITDAHYRLSRSSIHLRVMTDPKWTRVGLGFSQYSTGAFRIVQEFSTTNLDDNPIPVAQLQKIRKSIVNDLIQRHPNIKNENVKLSNTIKNWQNSDRSQTLPQALQSGGFNSYSYSTVKMNYSEDLDKKINDRKAFNDSTGKRTEVGVSLKMLEKGLTQVISVFI